MSDVVDATVESACCVKCAYLIVGLSEPRCPECGMPFDAAYVEPAARSCLLPWERREMGGRLRRFGRTVRLALFSLERYFQCAGRRSEKRIHRPWLFLAGCMAPSVAVCLVGYFVGVHAIYATWLPGMGKSTWTWHRIMRNSGTLAAPLFIPLGGKTVAVLVTALLIRLLHRVRLGALQTRDLAALFGPSILVSATAWAVAYVIMCNKLVVFDFLNASFLVERCYWLVVIWFCCRGLLLLSSRNAAVVVVLAGIADLSCRLADIWLVDPPLFHILFFYRSVI